MAAAEAAYAGGEKGLHVFMLVPVFVGCCWTIGWAQNLSWAEIFWPVQVSPGPG
jgi:hypothetical protein